MKTERLLSSSFGSPSLSLVDFFFFFPFTQPVLLLTALLRRPINTTAALLCFPDCRTVTDVLTSRGFVLIWVCEVALSGPRDEISAPGRRASAPARESGPDETGGCLSAVAH